MKLGIRGKLFLVSLTLILIAGTGSGLFIEKELRSSLESRTESELIRFAKVGGHSASGLAADSTVAGIDALADELGKTSETRITIIGRDGRVLGDSSLTVEELASLDNHGQRLEVVEALQQGQASSRRFSSTLEAEMMYAAARFESPLGPGVVRASVPLAQINEVLWRLHAAMLVAALFGLVIAVFMSGLASYLLTRTVTRLVEHARALARGERDRIEVESDDEFGRLAKQFNRLAETLQRTARKMAKEKDRFAAVLEGMNDAVVALSSKGKIKVINPSAQELLGLDESCIGQTLLESTRIPALHELTTQTAEGPISMEFELPNGRQVLADATPLQATGGMVVVMLDVTEMRRLETIRKDFVANVSHELRTPVSVIRANAETLLAGALEDEKRGPQFVQAILRNSERLSRLIADLLDLSRIEAGKYHLEIQSLEVDSAIRRALEAIEPAATERRVSWDLTASSDLEMLADPNAVDQVLLNLLENAVKYTKPGGKVIVRAFQKDDAVRIEVIDDGPGIPPHHRKRIFERFYRVDAGRSREMGGTGLGLSIVKHLIESMNGTVGVEPASPHGSVFWFVLPRSGQARLRLMA